MITARTLEEHLAEDAKSWELPVVGEAKVDTTKTNAINKTSDWKYEPPEEEEEILPPTAEEIEAIRQNAYEEGFEEGKQEGSEKGFQEGLAKGEQEGHQQGITSGREEGLQAGAEEIAAQAAVWQQLMENLHQPVDTVQQQLQKELVSLSVALARSVIKQEVKTNPDVIFQALTEGLKALPIGEKSYQIRMHPEDIMMVREQFSAEDIERHNWILVDAPELSRGGCDITTENNAVDVTIEKRSRDVLDKFLQSKDYRQT